MGGACDHIKVLGLHIKENIISEDILCPVCIIMLWRTLEPFLQTSSVKDGTCIHRPCCVPLPFQQSLLYSSLLCLLFLSSGYFNGARFFQGDCTDQRNAAGGMFIIMGFLWLVGVPLLIVAIVMVR